MVWTTVNCRWPLSDCVFKMVEAPRKIDQEPGKGHRRFIPRLIAILFHDRVVLITAASRLLSIVTAPLTIYFTVKYLTDAERGYYYTFFSLLGFSYLFDGAAAFTVQQKISQLCSRAVLNGRHELEGDTESVRQIADLFRATARWYGFAAIVFGVCVASIGILFFLATSSDSISVWGMPWILSVMTASLSLSASHVPALIQGISRVDTVAIAQVGRTVVSSLVLCGSLVAGWRLYAAPVSGVVGVVVWLGILRISWRPLIHQLQAEPLPDESVSWSREIWPMQWRMAISNTAGFFIYRALTPIVFSICGPATAGRFGMTQMAIDYVTQIAYSWLTVRTPRMSMLWASKAYDELIRLFRQTATMTVATFALGIVAGMTLLMILRHVVPSVPNAFLAPGEFLLLAAWGLANVLIACFATFGRSGGMESFTRLSLVFAVSTTVGGACVAFLVGEVAMYCWLALSSFCIFVPWAALIYVAQLPHAPNVAIEIPR